MDYLTLPFEEVIIRDLVVITFNCNLIKTLSEFVWIMLSMGHIMYLAQLAPLWHKKFYTKVEETLLCRKYNFFLVMCSQWPSFIQGGN